MKTNRSRNILIIVLSVIVIAAIIAAIVFKLSGNHGEKNGSEDTAAQSVVISEDAVAKDSLLQDKYPEVNTLITQYRKALTDGDVETLKKVYDTEDAISSDVLSSTSKIIEGYQNTSCYTKKGLEDGSYFVFIYDDLKLSGITTSVPNLTMVYVKKNAEGNYYIYRGEKNTQTGVYEYDAQTQAYIQKLYEDAEVKDLMAKVYDAKEAACAKDEQLRNFLDKLEGNSEVGSDVPSESESQSAGDSEESSQSSEETESETETGNESESSEE